MIDEKVTNRAYAPTTDTTLRDRKVGLSSSKKNYFINFNESPLKMMKIVFYFILKALSVLKISKYILSYICIYIYI